MKIIRRTVFWLLLVSLLLCPLQGVARADMGDTGYYAGENDSYALELAEDGYCYWYQDGARYAGKYTKDGDGFDLKLVGSGKLQDTAFRAERQKDGSLTVTGGLVKGERFSAAEKPADHEELDALWTKRIRHLKKTSGKISLTETVLLDDDGLKITAKKYSASGNSEEVRLLVENNGNQQVRIQTTAVRINDTMVDLFFYCNVAAHTSSKETLRISTTALEAAGIERIETVTPIFSIERNGETELVTDAVSIPVQDSRSRVSVLIPLQKTLLNVRGLVVELLGYENQGHEVELYYRVVNRAENAFTIRSTRTAINGNPSRNYAINQDVEGNSDMVYQADIWTNGTGDVGKLGSLSLSLQLESSYDNAFADFGEIRMEFEPSGQLCAFDCSVTVDESSTFWQDNYAVTEETEPQEPEESKPQRPESTGTSVDGQDADWEDDWSEDLNPEEEWWLRLIWALMQSE